jgi:predicted ester cyclase
MIRNGLPDFHNQVESMLAEDNKVVAQVRCTGTHRGKIFGLDPTGKNLSYAGVAIFTIGGHRLMSAWIFDDRYELMRQLGAISEP